MSSITTTKDEERKHMGLLGKGRLDSKRKGHISKSAIVAKFLQCGYVVLTPFGGSERYDLVIEDADGIFWRIQCKSGWIENGAVYFDTANHNVTGTEKGLATLPRTM